MNYLASILPIILYFLIIKGLDGFSISRWTRIAESFVWGITSCALCILITYIWRLEGYNNFPIVEEVLKALPLVIVVHRKRSTFFLEVLTYGAAIGAGFSFLENILYAYFQPLTLGDSIVRGLGTSLLHIGCTALFSGLALLMFRMSKGKPKAFRRTMTALSILPSAIVHFLYNLFLLPEYIQMLLTVVVFIGLFIWAFSLDDKLIHRWLDMCITNDIALYKAIKDGHLSHTHAGEYLLMLRPKFSPEVFFDICVFLGLYLEMTIAAKSRMILKEAGMDVPLTEQERKANSEKVSEVKALRKSIGKTAVSMLQPIVGIKDIDVWAMQQLQ